MGLGTPVESAGLVSTSDGGYVSGYNLNATIEFADGTTITPERAQDVAIVKFNSDTTVNWIRRISCVDTIKIRAMEKSVDEGFFVVASAYASEIYLEDGTEDGRTILCPDIMGDYIVDIIVKYDNNGNILWTQTLGENAENFMNPSTLDMIATNDGGCILVGDFTYKKADTTAYRDGIISRIDGDGNYIFKKKLNSEESSSVIKSVCATKDGGYVVNGLIEGNVTLENGTVLLPENGTGIIIKYNSNNEIGWVKQINGTMFGLKIFAKENGELILSGIVSKSIELESGVTIESPSGTQAIVLIKYDKFGNFIDAKYIDGEKAEWADEIFETEDGGYAVVGGTKSKKIELENGTLLKNNALSGIFIIGYDRDDNVKWSEIVGYDADADLVGRAIQLTDGTLVLGAPFYGTQIQVGDTINIPKPSDVGGVQICFGKEKVLEMVVTRADVISGENYEAIDAICSTSDGGYYVAGKMASDIKIGNITLKHNGSNLSMDAMILKYDQEGNIKWGKVLGGEESDTIYKITETSDGGCIVAGSFTDSINVNGNIITSSGSTDAMFVKYDKDGNIQWARSVGGSENDSSFDIAQTTDGGYVGAVSFYSSSIKIGNETFNNNNASTYNTSDVIIVKYNKDGVLQWAKQIGGDNSDEINSVIQTNDGGSIVAGTSSSSTLSVGSYVFNTKGNGDGIIIKYDKNGNVQWAKNVASAYEEKIVDLAKTNDGGFVVSGYFEGYLDLGNGILLNTSGYNDGMIIKYDKDGNAQWASSVGGEGRDYFNDVKQTNDGGYLVGGYFASNNMEIAGKNFRSVPMANGNPSTDGMIVKFNESGKTEWGVAVGAESADPIQAVAQLNNGTYVAGGMFNSSKIQLGNQVFVNEGIFDAMILRVGAQEGIDEIQELEVENNRKQFNITTDVEEIDGVKGGSISGEDENPFEIVKYGDSNTKEIRLVPDENYEIVGIKVNGEDYQFTANADGSFVMPVFVDVQEDKHIVVRFAYKDNKIIINKVDSNDNTKLLPGAKFRLEQISGDGDGNYVVEIETNSDGQAITQIPFGKYKVTEIEAPEGYWLNEASVEIDFVADGNHEFTMTNERKIKVIVHHYLKDTTTALAPDEINEGRTGESYITVPKMFIEYDLIKDVNGEYIYPDNAFGEIGNSDIEIFYYYEDKDISGIVHHYIAGTTNPVPLKDGNTAESETIVGKNGEKYTTAPISDKVLDSRYELVQIPSNWEGTFNFTDSIVIVYEYKLKEFKITTEVTQVNGVKGGTISGEGMNPYETVKAGENSTKPIEIKADEGYKIKLITIYSSTESGAIWTDKQDYSDSVEKEILMAGFTNMQENKHIVVEFERIKGTVRVNHYIEGTNTPVPLDDGTLAQEEVLTGWVGSKWTAKELENVSNKYELASIVGGTQGLFTEEDIDVVYYYKLKPAELIVHHYKEGTTESVGQSLMMIGRVDDEYTTTVGEDVPEYYELVAEPANKNGILTVEPTIVIYYYRLKEYGYVVNYLEKDNEDNILAPQKQGEAKVYGTQIDAETEVIPIDGYNVDSKSPEKLTIDVTGNVINIYYTRRNDLSYTVNYLEKGTNEELEPAKVVNGMTFEDVVKTQDEIIQIKGYNYDSADKDTLTIGTGSNVINIYYTKRNDLSYTVNYLEKDSGTVLADAKIVNGKTFGDVVKAADEIIQITGYNYDSVSSDSITIGVDSNVINIYYTKRDDLSYTVNYLEKGTNAVLKTAKQVDGQTFGDKIHADTELIEIKGYNYDSVSSDSITIGVDSAANVINIYYTRITGLSYTVNYLEKNTNEVIHIAKTVGNKTYGDKVISSTEIIDIDGYNYDSADKTSLSIGTGSNIINLYYTKRTDLSYTVNYLEKNTGKVLHDPKVVNNQIFKTVIQSSKEVINIDGYNYDSVSSDSITIGTGSNIINIYYVIRSDLSYTVNYLEKDTDNVLHAEKVVINKTFGDVVVSNQEVIPINGYNYDSVSAESITIGTGSNIINIYYTRRMDLSYTVNYLEKGTNEVLHAPETVSNQIFGTVVQSSTKVINIDGYKYDSASCDEILIGTETNVIDIYYTKRQDIKYRIEYYYDNQKDDSLTETGVGEFKSIIDTYTNKPKTGYKFENVEGNPITLVTDESKNVMKVYYVRDTFGYRVEYYYDGILDDTKTEKLTEIYGNKVTTYTDKNITGYKFEKTENNPLTITEVSANNVMKVYYVKDNFEYTVEYYYAGVKDEKATETGVGEFQSKVETYTEKLKDGYKFDRTENLPLTITEDKTKNIIKVHYKKRSDLSYTVNYLEKGTNKPINDVKVTEGVTFGDTIISSEEVISIYGYNYDSVDKDTLTITTGINEINIYYTKKDSSVLVHHYIENTTTKLAPDVTIPGKVGDNYTTGVGNVENKYEVVGIPANANGIMTEAQIIVTYYYRLKDTSVLVHHYIEGTSTSLSDDVLIEGKVDDDYNTTAATDVPSKYELVAEPGNKSGTMTVDQTVVTYYYRLKESGVTVHYYKEGTTTPVSADVVITGKVDDPYKTEAAKDVESKYELIAEPSNKEGIMGESQIVVIYYYRLKDTQVLVHHYKEGTTESLAEDEIIKGQVDDSYRTLESTELLYKYDLVADPVNKSGIMTEEQIVVTYYYRLKDTQVLVHHYKENTTEKVGEDVTITGKVDSEYTTTVGDDVPEYYELVAEPSNKTGIMTVEEIEVTYYYRLKEYGYVVNYLEKDNEDNILAPQKQGEAKVYGTQIDAETEVIPIDGYNVDSKSPEKLTIGVTGNVINIYYTKRNDLSYTVNYLEKGTNEELEPAKVVNGMTFEDEVTSSDEVISIEGYDYDSVDKDTLKIGIGANVINIYYTKRVDLSYKVNYLEKDTNKELKPSKVVNGMTFEDVVISNDEVITIDGYNYDSVSSDSIVIGTGENVIDIYYTKRTDLSYTVNYLEKDTDEVLHDAKVVNNVEFEAVITSSDEVISIDGYNYDSVDKDTLTIGTGANEINIYYTRRNDLSYTVNYLEKDTNEILNEAKVVGNQTLGTEINAADEVISIDGYNYDSVSSDSIVIGTETNVIDIYYTKRNDLSYTVNYLEKGTNEELEPAKVVNGMTFKDVVTSSDEVINIEGYNYDSVDKETLVITTGANEINIYYTKRADLSYVVNYLEKDTNKELKPAKVVNGMTFEDVVISSDEVIEIIGYNYDSVDKDTLTITAGANVINIYYTRKTDLTYVVNYIDVDTDKEIHPAKTVENQIFGDKIQASSEIIEIPGYDFVRTDKEELTIDAGLNVINIYYARKDAQVIVHYYEEGTTNKLSETITKDGKVFDNYTTEAATDVPIKYELISIPENASGIMTEETIIVNYYYRVKDTSLIVKYLEKGSNEELAPDVVKAGKVDDEYDESAILIENYTLVGDSGNATGKLAIEPTTVIFYYLQNTKVTVQHIDKTTGKIIEEITKDGLVGQEYTSSSKDFENYVLVERPEQETVTMGKEEIVLKYYYLHVSGGVIEKHIDMFTGDILANEVHTGKEGDPYDIPSRTFEGYDLVENKLPENSKGTMKLEPIEVIYYYSYRSSVVAEYVDKITGKKLTEDEVYDGHEGDDYTTERKQIDDYVLTEEPANADGTMTKEPIKVTYYYVHLTGGVIERHIDAITGKQLVAEEKFDGYEGESYKTEPENIPYYDLVEDKYPSNAEGTMTIEQIIVNYYYVRQAQVNVKYVDKITGEEISISDTLNGHEGDKYKTEPIEVPGYDLIETPANEEGTMTKDPIDVTYYYARPAKVVVNYLDIDTNEVLSEEVTIKGHQDDTYTTTSKDIQYYVLAKTPENTEGIMEVNVAKDENGDEIVSDTTYVNYYYRKMIFNLNVDKKVGSIIVNGVEKQVNSDLGKVEIYRKELATTSVQVVYNIVVTNDSELSGKAKLLENIPDGMVMKPEKNTYWDISETIATIETAELKPGQSVTYKVVLDWAKGENNLGTKENTVQIVGTENEAGFEEKDDTDNKDTADLIVTVGTGEYTYMLDVGIALIVLATVTVVLVSKRKKEE